MVDDDAAPRCEKGVLSSFVHRPPQKKHQHLRQHLGTYASALLGRVRFF